MFSLSNSFRMPTTESSTVVFKTNDGYVVVIATVTFLEKTYFLTPRTFAMSPLIATWDCVDARSSSTLCLAKKWREARGDLHKCKIHSTTSVSQASIDIVIKNKNLHVLFKLHQFLFDFTFFLFQEAIEHICSVYVSQGVVSAKVLKHGTVLKNSI